MTYLDYIPMYIKQTAARRTRETITAQDWNNAFNLLIQQGDNTAEYTDVLKNYLFVDEGGAFSNLEEHVSDLQNQLDNHEADNSNPHNVQAQQVPVNPITGVDGGYVQPVLTDLKKQIDNKINEIVARDIFETKADAGLHIVNVVVNEDTGVFTFYRNNGTTFTVDTNLEKIAMNWVFNSTTQKLILTLADGTTQEVDLSAFITETEFKNSDSITFSVSGHVVAAAVNPTYMNAISSAVTSAQHYASEAQNSATTAIQQALDAKSSSDNAKDYMDEATAQSVKAKEYASSASSSKANAAASERAALNYAKTAQSYAIGGSGIRTGEDTDNAFYYSEQAKYWAGQAAAGQVQADFHETDPDSKAYIKNKPEVDQVLVPSTTSTNAVSSAAVWEKLSLLSQEIHTDIDSLEDRVVETETDINTLKTKVGTAETAIANLEGRVSATETTMPKIIEVNEYTIPTSAWVDSTQSDKYAKEAKVLTDKYGANFVPQYIDVIPNGNFFTEDEEADKGLLSQTVIFADDGFYVFAEDVPSANVHLRIGGAK